MKKLITILFLLAAVQSFGQARYKPHYFDKYGNLVFGATNAHITAIIDIVSTTQGVRFSPMNTAQMNAISSPGTGVFVFNTDSLMYCVYNGTAWLKMGGGGGGGSSTDTTNKFVNYLTRVGDSIHYNRGGNWYGIYAPTSGSSSTALSGITDAAGTNTINNAAYTQTWNWNSLTSGSGIVFGSTSITSGKVIDISVNGTAATNGQTGINVLLTGANGTSSMKTYAARFSNTHTGTTPSNWALSTVSGNVGFGDPTNADADNLVIIRNSTNTLGKGLRIYAQNESVFLEMGWGKISYGGELDVYGGGGVKITGASGTGVKVLADGKVNLGSNTSPTSTVNVAGSLGYAYVAKTANYTATISDYYIEVTANSPTITLPTAASITGRTYVITNTGAGTVTIETTSSQVIGNQGSGTTYALEAGSSIEIYSNGSAWRIRSQYILPL